MHVRARTRRVPGEFARHPAAPGQLCRQVTENDVPPERLEVLALTVVPDTMLIWSGAKLPIGWPFAVVAEKLAVPKSVSGSTPEALEGASAIASAEASRAECSLALMVWLQPWVWSVRVSVKLPAPLVVTEPANAAPGRTVLLK